MTAVYYGHVVIGTEKLRWDGRTSTFSAEVSDLDELRAASRSGRMPRVLVLRSHRTGSRVSFRFVRADRDGSGEDVYGWNYRADQPAMNLLIIND